MNSLADIWARVLEIIGKDMTSIAITTWFDDCTAVDIYGSRLVLHTPTEFKKRIIETRFKKDIEAALYEIFSSEFDTVILCGDELERYMAQKQAPVVPEDEGIEEFTFDNFVVGPSNKFAHATAVAVSEGRKKDYNPLVIYGPSGLGKTHLLMAIRHAIREKHPEYNIVYIKGDDFTNQLVAAIQAGNAVAFREKYRNADLFLMDDVHTIAGKESTQEEFFHTFNTLREENKQIVVTSDRPPQDISRLADRLRTRLESGMLADVQPPDYETRMAIIRTKANQLGIVIPDSVANYIAENLTSNIRQIEGAVNKIKAYRDLMDETIDVPTVARILKDMFKEKSSYITPDAIIEETAKYFSISVDDIKGPSRTKIFVTARQVAMYLIRTLTNFSLIEIGTVFNNRDHATVINSLNKVEQNIKDDPNFYKIIRDITSNINSRS